MAGILPPLTFEEALEVTTIHSVAGLRPSRCGPVVQRPLRAPHHTISNVALVGAGAHPRPGEISLIARDARTCTFPARFMPSAR